MTDSCPHCQRMAQQIERLEREVGVRKRDGEIASVMSRLDVSATHARLLLRLYAAGGKPVTRDALLTLLSTPEDNNLSVAIYRIRTLLGDEVIVTDDTIGYHLSAVGLSRVMAALRPVEMAEERAA